MNEISILDLRRNAGAVIRKLRRGICLTLTYRGKRMARLIPMRSPQQPTRDDPFYHITELATADAGGLANADIDEILYGKP
jgi:antitoxin (DNA-binding transcriptional repressor) of toxin-antitoxin stability system